MKVLLPTSVPLDPKLPEGVEGVSYDPEAELRTSTPTPR